MTQDGDAGTAMLGLGGFVLLAVSSAFGELEQAVEGYCFRLNSHIS